MISLVLFNFIVVSFCSFITSLIFIKLIMKITCIKSSRFNVYFLLIPLLKLPLDVFLWNSKNWAMMNGLNPYFAEENTRELAIAFTGLISQIFIKLKFVNGLSFTIADLLYGLFGKSLVIVFLMMFFSWYLLKLLALIGKAKNNHKEIILLVQNSYILNLKERRELQSVLTKAKINVLINNTYTGSPFVTGFFNRKIIMPAQLLDSCSQEEVDAILFHEIGHVCHKDIFINTYILIASAIFAHLPIRNLTKEISFEQELACDRSVIYRGIDKIDLCKALFNCASLKNIYSIGFTNGEYLLKRIKTIQSSLNKREKISSYLLKVIAIYLGVLVLFGRFWIV